jgi:rhodanese-related sulfurtransferase
MNGPAGPSSGVARILNALLAMDIQRISKEELKRKLDTREAMTILDARSPEAWRESDVQLPGAIRIPPDEVDRHLAEIPRDRPIVTYCT